LTPIRLEESLDRRRSCTNETQTDIGGTFACCVISRSRPGEEKEKHGHIGLASFATVIESNISGAQEDELAGPALFAGFAVNDNFGGRATIASQDHEDTENIEATAFEANFMAGTGLATEGFKAYGSFGFSRIPGSSTR